MTKSLHSHGFTLMEVLVTIVVLSALITTFYLPQIKSDFDAYNKSLIEIIGDEIYRLGAAAQAYIADNAEWPDETHGCVQAIERLASENYLPNFTRASGIARNDSPTLPFDTKGAPARSGHFYTECGEDIPGSGVRRHFAVRFVLPDIYQKYAGLLKNLLPQSQRLINDTVEAVEAVFPLPAAIPAFDELLAVSGEREMEGDLLLGGNQIAEADDVYLSTGQSLGSVVTYAGIVRVGTQVRKPDCPAHYTPTITVAPADVSHSSGAPITKVLFDALDTGTAWAIRSRIFASGEGTVAEENHGAVSAAVFVRCQI